jgi:hypothetical protein
MSMTMASSQSFRFFALLTRELREYRTSFLWTPIGAAVILAVIMLASVVLANRITIVGDTILEALLAEGGNGVNVRISVNEDTGEEMTLIEIERGEGAGARGEAPLPPEAPEAPSYTMTVEEEMAPEQWNFSREWNFNPGPSDGVDEEDEVDASEEGTDLNVMLGVLHNIMLLLLLVTTVNYLVSALYDDRKDRSILFWRSLPVIELEVVASKFVTALVLAPIIYVAISLVLQLVYVLLMMLLVWRLERDPFAVVLGNIDFVSLMLDPISGWLMTALLVAPAYAYFLLISAFARRSPLIIALAVPIALHIAERFFIGTQYIGETITRHVPHASDESAVGFYLFGPDWTSLDLASVAGGLAFAAVALAGAVWLRKYRWELN